MLNISLKKTIRYLKDKDYNNLVLLLGEVWENHPDKNSPEYDMWREQLALNLPILYIASICLHKFVEKHGIRNILFATRDCAHWHKVYQAMYPDDSVHYFNCSRNMFNTARDRYRPYYEKYIKSVTSGDIDSTVYVDIHGTGRRMYGYFKERHNKIPKCFILSSGHSVPENLPIEIQKMVSKGSAEFLVFSADGSPIEMLNYDVIGTCNDYDKYGPVRAAPEYDISDIEAYHDCVSQFIKLLKQQSSLDDHHSFRSMVKVVNYLFEPALSTLPIIADWIDPERKHKPVY